MTAGDSAQKLTKKQKKALAFRDRGKKSSSNNNSNDNEDAAATDSQHVYGDVLEMEDNAVPVMEDQDLADLQGGGVEVEGGGECSAKRSGDGGEKGGKGGAGKGKGKDKVRKEETELVSASKGKRKREDDEEVKKQPKKKQKTVMKTEGEDDKERKAQRFILFVGNLKYTTTKEQILAHFAKTCKPPPTVRLLTPKPRLGVVQRPKSKGCAFLEFLTKAPLQEALKLHQSMLDDRMINVELTAGGGGKSEARLTKLRERNKALIGQRIKKVEQGDKSAILSRPDKPQRYSATSGLDQAEAQMTKRTWSVGDVVEETHRGGKRHQKRGTRKPSKSHGTGVNAIPVG